MPALAVGAHHFPKSFEGQFVPEDLPMRPIRMLCAQEATSDPEIARCCFHRKFQDKVILTWERGSLSERYPVLAKLFLYLVHIQVRRVILFLNTQRSSHTGSFSNSEASRYDANGRHGFVRSGDAATGDQEIGDVFRNRYEDVSA